MVLLRRWLFIGPALILGAGLFLRPPVAAADDPDAAIGPLLIQKARDAVAALKEKNMQELARLVHPKKGLRFSPYAFVDSKGDVVLTRAQLARALRERKLYQWGHHDGSGDPIQMSFAGYYKRFVYDVDFAGAPQVSFNQPIKTGNTASNLAEVYPKARFVEFHFPGFDPEMEGMDWRSLRLVFEKSGAAWFLVHIVHDQWTI